MRDVELIYAGVNPRKVGELNAFRERADLYSEVYRKKVYRTWSLGEGDEAVVFLPGGMGHGEVWFPQMLHLRGIVRSIAFSLPECKSLDEAADGILYTLEAMGIRRAMVAGYSLGGLIAQWMPRKEPERIAGLALCLTGAPSKDLPDEIVKRWGRRKSLAMKGRLMGFEGQSRINMAEGAFKANCPPGREIELEFWRAFIEDTYCNYVYKKQYINLNYVAQPNLYEKRPFSPDDALGNCKALILHSEQDALYAPEHEYLKALYPNARAVNIGDSGQFAMLTDGELVSREIEALARECFRK